MKGILFTEDMFKLVIEGKKTQTRRLVKFPKYIPSDAKLIGKGITQWTTFHFVENDRLMEAGMYPRYFPREEVYLKEPYIIDIDGSVYYRYDFPVKNIMLLNGTTDKWRNKLFMPEKYARYKIFIEWVRIQRLSKISVYDAIAEGFIEYPKIIKFFDKWKEINGPDSLKSDPYVWIYEFKLTENERT